MKPPEIRGVKEQRPLENLAVLSFLNKWCEVNDSIRIQIVSRQDWENRDRILAPQPDGTKILYLPRDLQLWEIIGVIEAVDRDTFVNNPEKQEEAKEKLIELGKIFQNAGVYIAQRLEDIKEGREIAEALALEFYEYGRSLIEGKKPETRFSFETLASINLTPEEVETIDKFLAGEKLYASRKARLEEAVKEDPSKRDELYEAERRRALAQFFRAMSRALLLEKKQEEGKLKGLAGDGLKPWQKDTPIHKSFLQRIETALKRKIETPRIELAMAIFRRGLQKLLEGMKYPQELEVDIQEEQKRLVDALNLYALKAELEEIRRTGNMREIVRKEREIADKIQRAVSKFPYKAEADNPTEMVVNQYINCVGASMLGGLLMREVGLNYLVVRIPRHSVLLLITSDGTVEWRDMLTSPRNNDILDDRDIEGVKEDGTPLTVSDIVSFSRKSQSEGLTFYIKSDRLRRLFPELEEYEPPIVEVLNPEYGHQMLVMYNLGVSFIELGRYEEAIELFTQIVDIDPQNYTAYFNLGFSLYMLGRYEEAIEAYRKAIDINPKLYLSYFNLGNCFYKLGSYQKAAEAYQQAINMNPKYAGSYLNLGEALSKLGDYKRAIKAYYQGIDLEGRNVNPDHLRSFFNLGLELLKLGHYEDAVGVFLKVARSDINNIFAPDVFIDLGDAYSKLREYKAAVLTYKRALEFIDPEKHPELREQVQDKIKEAKRYLREQKR